MPAARKPWLPIFVSIPAAAARRGIVAWAFAWKATCGWGNPWPGRTSGTTAVSGRRDVGARMAGRSLAALEAPHLFHRPVRPDGDHGDEANGGERAWNELGERPAL